MFVGVAKFDVGDGFNFGLSSIHPLLGLLELGALFITISFFGISGALAGIFCAEKINIKLSPQHDLKGPIERFFVE